MWRQKFHIQGVSKVIWICFNHCANATCGSNMGGTAISWSAFGNLVAMKRWREWSVREWYEIPPLLHFGYIASCKTFVAYVKHQILNSWKQNSKQTSSTLNKHRTKVIRKWGKCRMLASVKTTSLSVGNKASVLNVPKSSLNPPL